MEKDPTICLNMIVKNESKIIERMLDSVISIIDSYCICDTGSTDNTVEIITNYFTKKNISGKITFEPFKNFAYNRTFALKDCYGMSDYILLMDADMILDIKTFKKTDLWKADNFNILQGISNFYYPNVRFIKNNNKNKYIGVTHEYVDLPSPVSLNSFSKETLFIYDKGDGGSKGNKLERDIKLLTDGIDNEPENRPRYYFYLANTYFDSGDIEKAIVTYKKRIEFGGWEQELWYSYFRTGLAYKKLNKMDKAITWWLDAYNCFPYRIENMYEIVSYYRYISKHKVSKIFLETCKNIILSLAEKKINKDSFIFLQNDLYTYKLDMELIVLAGYIGLKDLRNEIVCVLNNSENESDIADTFSNMKFCKFILEPIYKKDLTTEFYVTLNSEKIKLYSSSASMIPDKNGGYLMNERLVNYTINKNNGTYNNCEKHVITYNKYYELTSNFQIIKEKMFDIDYYKDKMFLGVEDVRIFSNINNDIDFMGVTFHSDNKIGVVFGEYNVNDDIIKYNEIKTNFNNLDREKNWVFINYKKETCIIYSWFPLKICKLNKDTNCIELFEEKQIKSKIFRFCRGSSSGFFYQNEYWFINHLVAHDVPRNYYHMFAVFDESMNLLRYSAPFKFEGENIEYCLGLIVEKERVIVNYSTWDNTNKLVVYDKTYIDKIVKFIE